MNPMSRSLPFGYDVRNTWSDRDRIGLVGLSVCVLVVFFCSCWYCCFLVSWVLLVTRCWSDDWYFDERRCIDVYLVFDLYSMFEKGCTSDDEPRGNTWYQTEKPTHSPFIFGGWVTCYLLSLSLSIVPPSLLCVSFPFSLPLVRTTQIDRNNSGERLGLRVRG